MPNVLVRRQLLVLFTVMVVAALAVVAINGGTSLAGDDGIERPAAEAPAAAAVATSAAQAHTKLVSMAAFQSISTPDVTRTMVAGSFCATGVGHDPNFNSWQLTAPVELPVGAVITGMNADLYDADANNITLYLVRSDLNDRSLVVAIASSGTAGFGNFAASPFTHTVTAHEGLWLVYDSSAAGANLNGICGVQIEYEIPSDNDNLVFTALAAPCRLFDTKAASAAPWVGPLGPVDGAVSFEITTPSAGQVGNQGGAACAETAVPADAVAVSINIIARSPLEQGHIRAAATGSATQPMVNYSLAAGMNNSSAVTVALGGGSMDIQIGGLAALTDSVDVRGVVLGYFTPGPNVSD